MELKAQAEKLMLEAEAARKAEVEEVLTDIRAKMQAYGLTLKDIGTAPPSKGQKTTTPMKYRGPNGELWGGGRGRKPDWILAGLKVGKKLEDFAI